MVGRFVRLRLALLRGGFRTGNVGMTIATILSLLMAAVFGLLGFVGGMALRWAPVEVRDVVVPVALVIIYLVWLLGPLTVSGSDGSMDPVRLVLLPLTRGQLAAGLAAAGLVGPGGLATTLAVLGLVAGMAPVGPGLIAVVLGGVLFLALCILTSRCLVSLVGIGMRRRGIRDVLAVAIPLVVIVLSQLPNILSNVLRAAGPEATALWAERALAVLRFVPSSFAANAIVRGSHDDLVPALAELLGGLAVCLAIGWVWSLLLRRIMTTPPGIEGAAKGHSGTGVRVQALLPHLPRRAAAVANKDLTLMRREPSQRVQLIMAGIFSLAAVIAPAIAGRGIAELAFVTAGLGMFLGMVNANMYGYDGSSMWVNVAAGDDAKADLTGKVVARLLIFTPVVLAASVALGLLLRPSVLLATVGVSSGSWLVCLGLGTLQSVLAPYPVVTSEDAVMGRNQGSLQAFIAQLVTFPILAVTMGPLVYVGIMWIDDLPILAGVGVAGLVVGLIGLYVCVRLAISYARDRQPELLQLVSKRVEA